MWSQYDENLTKNPFFIYIQKHHNDILEKASTENWMICIPRLGALESCDLTVDIILDHVLVPGNSEDYNIYYTLSKKQVSVQNKHISIDCSNTFSNGIEILFEETYIQTSSKYRVWCIDSPLFLPHNHCNSHSSRVLTNLHDCIDFLWCESLGHHILDNVKQLVTKFTQDCGEIEIEDIQTQKELIGKLFSQCLQVGLKNEAIREKCMSNKSFFENFKLAVETYMQFCLGRKLMFCVNTLQYQSDSYLNKILRNSSALQYQDLDISDKFLDTITSAKCEMNKINNYYTVLDKVNCFKRILSIIYDCSNKLPSVYVTSDDILQILVFLLVKVNVNNWMANLIFLKEFRFGSTEASDQSSFIITSFEAAIEFIKSSQFLDIQKKVKSLESSHSALKSLCDNITPDNVVEPFSKLLPRSLLSNRKLCHPLCTCTKCETKCFNISERNFSRFNLNPNDCNDDGQNILTVATIAGNFMAVEYLINHGFSVDCADSLGKTSLHHAASKGYQNILLLLLNRHANVNVKDNEQNTPLHLACANGQENCVKALIYSTAEIELDNVNFFGETPLHLATCWGFYDIIKILLENGASSVFRNRRNQTVLDIAPNYYIRKLFEKFGSVQKDTSKNALSENDVVLEEDKQQERDCSEHGDRPKHIDQFRKIDHLLKAIEHNDFPLTCFYLGFCNKSKTVESVCCHPLCDCEKCQKIQEDDLNIPTNCFETININMCDMTGHTPLHVAAKFGRSDILRSILDSGASINVQTYKTLYTPLHLACEFQHIQIVRELLKCGDCKIDKQDFKGNTPLHYACEKNDIKIVEMLLNNGADCRKKNYLGESALHECEEHMRYRILKMMKSNLAGFELS